MNEVFPLGTPLRWHPQGADGPALVLQVGVASVVVDDAVAAVLWRLLGGEPTFRLDGGLGRDELVELMGLRFGADGSEAERRAVHDAVDSLVRCEAAAELDTSDPEQLRTAAATLRLRGLGGVIGSDPTDENVFRLGIKGVVELPVTRRELELFIRADSGRSLWDLAHEMSADPVCYGSREDVDWSSANAQLPFIFFEVRRMLWHGLAYLDVMP